MPIAITILRLYNGVVAYYSPEGFNLLDGDHDYTLHADWRTPRQAAKVALGFQGNFEGCVIGLNTPDGEVRVSPSGPLPEVFTAYLRREKVLVYTPDVLSRNRNT